MAKSVAILCTRAFWSGSFAVMKWRRCVKEQPFSYPAGTPHMLVWQWTEIRNIIGLTRVGGITHFHVFNSFIHFFKQVHRLHYGQNYW